MSPGARPASGRTTFALCLAQVLGMLAFATYSANILGFREEWALTFTEAGLIGGVFSAGNVLAIPVLVSATDRVPARLVYLWSTGIMGLACLGFALLAEGFWTGLAFRGLYGVGFAGTLLPGLRLLSEAIPPGPAQTRAVTVYSACGALGGGASYLLSGILLPTAGWRIMFWLGVLGAALAILTVLAGVPVARSRAASAMPARRGALPDFRPVVRNPAALAYIFANAGHQFENYGARAWAVGFLWFSLGTLGLEAAPLGLQPAIWIGMIVLAGFLGNMAGGWLGLRLGRRPAIFVTVAVSLAVAVGLGLGPLFLPIGAILALFFLHSASMAADNPVLNAGVVAVSDPAFRGATMAVYGMIGFAGAMLGPTAFGMVLDAFGRGSWLGWALAWTVLGGVGVLGSLGLVLVGEPKPAAASLRGAD